MHPLVFQILSIAALIFGFGFVVFFHELGHFLAAKAVGIKVEQFAIGFGHAVASWRRGMGFTWGSSGKKMAKLQADGADTSGLGETEYRINWMPLGGYVKMLGQDDMNPNATSEDPRSFNRKSVAARVLVVSAGVIMNVILAVLLFIGLFLYGYNVAPPVVRSVEVGSPAQLAGIQPGDRILSLDGEWQGSFMQLHLAAALVSEGEAVPVEVRHADGSEEKLFVTPRRPDRSDAKGFLDLGVGRGEGGAPLLLEGVDLKQGAELQKLLKEAHQELDPAKDIMPGDRIVKVAGQPVKVTDWAVLDEALQKADGKPVMLTVEDSAGKQRQVAAQPQFESFFGDSPNVLGMQMRPLVARMEEKSPAAGQLKENDIITGLRIGGPDGEVLSNLSSDAFREQVRLAAERERPVAVRYERDGKEEWTKDMQPTFRTGQYRRGLGVGLDLDEDHAVISEISDGSVAAGARLVATPAASGPATMPLIGTTIPRGSRIVAIDGQPVKSWYDVPRLLKQAKNEARLTLEVPQGGKTATAEAVLPLDEKAHRELALIRYTADLRVLKPDIQPRKTSNPWVATKWGIGETKTLLRQFYVTLRRLTQGSVSGSNFMGPLGIVYSGSIFAMRGADWLIWFLAMISANLAVVNFLPIPVVDGGLFLFLMIEKIQGKPLSARMQTVAQLVGLAIILSVFVFVTYHDIARMFL